MQPPKRPDGWVPPEKRTTSEREEGRAFGREITARNYHKHLEKQGKYVPFETVKSMINERADRVDNRKDIKK